LSTTTAWALGHVLLKHGRMLNRELVGRVLAWWNRQYATFDSDRIRSARQKQRPAVVFRPSTARVSRNPGSLKVSEMKDMMHVRARSTQLEFLDGSPIPTAERITMLPQLGTRAIQHASMSGRPAL